ncbi:hypothetical protein Tco_1078847 [Tanacetum coccineum]|uniref:Uncharacterized protein n=1 Tax=Tanacetum coccineum TaxID=301880 RepID=A0ABQ5HQ63_9ASTR
MPAGSCPAGVINARLPVPLLLLFTSEVVYFSRDASLSSCDVPLTLASFFARLFKMTDFAAKHSIMTPEIVENFCNDYYIPDEVHPVAPGRDNTITQFSEVTGCIISAAAPEVSAPEVPAPAEVEPENVVPEDTYLDLTGPDEVVATQPGKSKRKRLGKQSDTLPAKQLRKDHPSFATGTGGKTLAGLRQLMPTSSRPSFQADIQAHVVQSARITDVPVYTAAATVTSARENVGITPTSDVAGSSQLETSEGSDDSFYELPALNSAEAKRWYVPRWNITNDSLLDDGFSCRTLVDRVAPWLFLYPPQLKNSLILKSLLGEEVGDGEEGRRPRRLSVRDQVSHALDDSQAACAEAGGLITSLTSERDRLSSEVSTLHAAFQDFKEKAEAQQEEQAQYQGILGHALGRAMDFGMQEGLEAGHEHGVAGTPLSAVEAYNPEVAKTSYFDAVRALEDVDFPLINLLKSKKDAGMDESRMLYPGRTLADLPGSCYLQPCLSAFRAPSIFYEQGHLLGETSLSFALLNVHSRAEGAKKHAAALRQLMMEIVSNPLSSQTWVGETSTDEALGSVVAIPKFKACRF